MTSLTRPLPPGPPKIQSWTATLHLLNNFGRLFRTRWTHCPKRFQHCLWGSGGGDCKKLSYKWAFISQTPVGMERVKLILFCMCVLLIWIFCFLCILRGWIVCVRCILRIWIFHLFSVHLVYVDFVISAHLPLIFALCGSRLCGGGFWRSEWFLSCRGLGKLRNHYWHTTHCTPPPTNCCNFSKTVPKTVQQPL